MITYYLLFTNFFVILFNLSGKFRMIVDIRERQFVINRNHEYEITNYRKIDFSKGKKSIPNGENLTRVAFNSIAVDSPLELLQFIL